MGDKSYHHGDLPQALLRAVQELICEQAEPHVSLRQVAKRAGVSPSAPAHHFGDKKGMLTAFATQGFQLLDQVLKTSIRANPEVDTTERIAVLGRGYLRFALDNPEHFFVMFRPELYDTEDLELRSAADPTFDKLLEAVSEHQRSGWRPSDDTLALTVSIWAALHGLASLWLGGLLEHRLSQQGVEPLTSTLLSGVVGLDRSR